MQVNATTPLPRIEVTCDMPGLTSRAGTALLPGLADKLGLTRALTKSLTRHTRSRPGPKDVPLNGAAVCRLVRLGR